MTVSVETDRIVLSGTAPVEDAEPLLAALIDQPTLAIDVSGIDRAHLAVVQLVRAAGRPLIGEPADAMLRDAIFGKLIQISPI